MIKISDSEREILERYFNICENDEYIELEIWTNSGVDMFIYIEHDKFESVLEGIEKYIDDFDIDDVIDTYRHGKDYRETFTIKESLKDFEQYIETLTDVCSELESLEV